MNPPPEDQGPDQKKDRPRQSEFRASVLGERAISFLRILLFTILIAYTLKMFVVEAFRIPSGSMENTLLVGDYLIVNKLSYGIRTPRYLPLTNLEIPSFTLSLFGSVRRGDVVVFEFPWKHIAGHPPAPEYYIKRCVGMPGDTVVIRSGHLMINGAAVRLPSRAKSSVFPENGLGLDGRSNQIAMAGIDGNNFGPVIVPGKGDTIVLTPGTAPSWKEFIEREHHDVQISPNGSLIIDGVATERYQVQSDYYFMLGDNRGNSLDSRYWGFVPDDHIVGEALLLYWSWDPKQSGDRMGDRFAGIRWSRIGALVQ